MLDKILIDLVNDLTGQSVNWDGLTAHQRSLINTYRSEIEKSYLPREQVEAVIPTVDQEFGGAAKEVAHDVQRILRSKLGLNIKDKGESMKPCKICHSIHGRGEGCR